MNILPKSSLPCLSLTSRFSGVYLDAHKISTASAPMPFGNSREESQRDSIPQPRVARNELPWEIRSVIFSTLKGLCRGLLRRVLLAGKIQPFQGWRHVASVTAKSGRVGCLLAPFLFTPALSLRERVNYGSRCLQPNTPGKLERWFKWLPLPKGEGWGEGEQVVRTTHRAGSLSGYQICCSQHE
jgi:hypothetical protein